jgi:Flp pilus assembly pilin Flp
LGPGLRFVAESTSESIEFSVNREDKVMKALAIQLWRNEEGQDIAEYAVMLAVILVIVIGTVRLIGGNANNVFSSVASSISQ